MQLASLYLHFESVNLQIHDMVVSETMSAKTHLFALKTMGLPSPARVHFGDMYIMSLRAVFVEKIDLWSGGSEPRIVVDFQTLPGFLKTAIIMSKRYRRL
jgi:hypothetical protein